MKHLSTRVSRSVETIEKQIKSLMAVGSTLSGVSADDPAAAFALDSVKWEEQLLQTELREAEIFQKGSKLTDEVIALSKSGNYGAAKEKASECLLLLKNEMGLNHIGTAIALHNLGTELLKNQVFDDAANFLQSAMKVVDSLEDYPELLDHIKIGLAGVYAYTDRSAESIKLIEDVLLHCDEQTPVDRMLIDAQSALVAAYRQTGKTEEALKIQLTLIDEVEKTPLFDEDISSIFYNNAGTLYMEVGNIELAERYLTMAVEDTRKKSGNEHPNLASCLISMGYLRALQQNIEAARSLTQEALQIARKALGENHPITLMALTNLNSLASGQPLQSVNSGNLNLNPPISSLN